MTFQFKPTLKWWYYYHLRRRRAKRKLWLERQRASHPTDFERPKIIRELILTGMTQSEIARELGISRQRVSQLIIKGGYQEEYRLLAELIKGLRFQKKAESYVRQCQVCGYRTFVRHKYCSDNCRREAKAQRAKAYYRSPKGNAYYAEYRKQKRLDELQKSS